MNTLLFATAPFPRPESIIALNGQTPDAEFIAFSPTEIDELRSPPAGAFTAIAPTSGTMEAVSLPDQLPEQVQGTAAKAICSRCWKPRPCSDAFFTADGMRRRSRYRRAVDRGDVAEEIRREAGRARPDACASAAAFSPSSVFCPRPTPRPLSSARASTSAPWSFRKSKWKTVIAGRRVFCSVSPRRCPAASLGQHRFPWQNDGSRKTRGSTPTTTFGFQLAGRVGGFRQ